MDEDLSFKWMRDAACFGKTDLFALPIEHKPRRDQVVTARRVCYDCPVFADCEAWVMQQDDPAPWMIVAGTTPEERRQRRLAPDYPQRPKPRPPCGTREGYNCHRRLGEPTCTDCRAANAAEKRFNAARVAASSVSSKPRSRQSTA